MPRRWCGPGAGRSTGHGSGRSRPGRDAGSLGTGAAYVLNYRLITDEGPTATSTVTYLLPVVAVVLGIVFLGEPAAAHLLIGTGIVLVGSLSCSVAHQYRRRRREPRPESASREQAAWDGLLAVLVAGASFFHHAQGERDLAGRSLACPTPSHKRRQPTRHLSRARSAALSHGRLRWLRRLPLVLSRHATVSTVPPGPRAGQTARPGMQEGAGP
jgi:EamA-like transporter family